MFPVSYQMLVPSLDACLRFQCSGTASCPHRNSLPPCSAFYGGAVSAAAARESLLSAQVKWQRLAVSDGALASMLAMGFTASEVRKILENVFLFGDIPSCKSDHCLNATCGEYPDAARAG